uniref:SnoaL-like domain-containing protein n=1 Tax=Oryza punctata TaxID=4537 RepID=A0A0E0JU23_ORYPU
MPPPIPACSISAVAAAASRARLLPLPSAAHTRCSSTENNHRHREGFWSTSSFTTTASGTGTGGMEKVASPSPAAAAGGAVSQRIMPHLLNIYGSCATARDFEIYAAHATFEDPLMRAHGVKQIKSAFYTLPKVFGESKIVEYTITENETAPGKVEILIDNKQHYKFLGKAIDLTSLITLDVEDGKIVKHQDWWDKKPLKSRETVSFPVVGRLAEASRRGAMLLTHALMGCGKDP